MPTPKPPAATIYSWLKANLGPRCLAPLTGTDARALQASVQIVELYSQDRDEAVIDAFRLVVLRMQPQTRELAYHSIAMILEWGTRAELWARAELPPIENPRRCQYES